MSFGCDFQIFQSENNLDELPEGGTYTIQSKMLDHSLERPDKDFQSSK